MVYAKEDREVASTMKKVYAHAQAILFLEAKVNASFLDVVPMMPMTTANPAYPLSF